MPMDIKTLNPASKGGLGRLAFAGAGVAILAFVGVTGYNVISHYAGQINKMAGISSALGLPEDQATQLTQAGGNIAYDGQLGRPVYPYTTVTFTLDAKDKLGDSIGSINQYIWDAQPANWLDETTISDDYTEGAPLTTTITDGTMTASLSSTNNFVADPSDSSLIKLENKKYYVFGGITNARDRFFTVDIPNAGAFDTTSPTLDLGEVVVPLFDTTAWTSSAIDLGVDANYSANHTYKKLTSYAVGDNNVVFVKQIKIDDLNIMGDDGDLEEFTVKLNDCVDWTVYDYSEGVLDATYSSGGYDAKLTGKDPTKVLCEIDAKDYADLEVQVTGKWCTGSLGECSTAGIGNRLRNGQTIAKITVYDLEGNAIVNSQNITG